MSRYLDQSVECDEDGLPLDNELAVVHLKAMLAGVEGDALDPADEDNYDDSWESDTGEADMGDIDSICNLLNIDPDELFGIE